MLTGSTATALHGCFPVRDPVVHVAVPYSKWVRTTHGLVVHHDRFADADIELVAGLPTFRLDHAVAEVLCRSPRWVALASLDQALAGRTDEQARRFVDAVGYRLSRRDNRRGTRQAEWLLPLGSTGAESPQESRLRLTVIEGGLPRPVTQHPIMSLSGEQLYRLDLGWPEVQLGAEYDGVDAHDGREAYDAARDARLTERGWKIVRARKDVFADPAPFLAELRNAFTERGFRLAG